MTNGWDPLADLPPAAYEVAGIAGVALYVGAYALISVKRLNARGVTYFGLNLVAATFVLISLAQAFNLAALLIQVFWIGISLSAIVLRLCGRGEPDPVRVD